MPVAAGADYVALDHVKVSLGQEDAVFIKMLRDHIVL